MGNTIGEKQVVEGPTSNGVGFKVPEQFLGETTQEKEADWTIDNGGDGRSQESLDREGPEQYIAKSTNTRLGASQGRQKHFEVQWKDSWLQPCIR